MHGSVANEFLVRKKIGKQQHYKKRKQIRYFNTVNIAEWWCESAVVLKVPSLVDMRSTQFLVATFLQLALLIHGQLSVSLRRVERSVICKCQLFCYSDILCHRSPPKGFQIYVLIVTYLFSIFIYQITKSTKVLCVSNILKEHPKVFRKMFILTSTEWRFWDILKTSFLNIFFKCFSISLLFFNIDYR